MGHLHLIRHARRALLACIAIPLAQSARAQVPLIPIVADNQPVPGLPAGYTASPSGNARINAQGILFIPAELSGPGIISGENSSVALTGSPTALSIVAASGMPVPGAPAGFIVSTQFSNSVPSNSAAANLSITLTDPDTFDLTSAFWLGIKSPVPTTPGTPIRMYGAGDAAPAPILSATISSASSSPSLSPTGRFAGYIVLSGPSISGTNNRLLLTGVPGQPPIIAARQGDLAPGIPANEPGGPAYLFINDQTGYSINAAGQILFRATLVNASGSSLPFNPSALYRYDPAAGGALILVAREGNSPGSGTINFGTQVPNESISMNSSGNVAFQTQQGSGSGNFVIWAGTPGALTIAARSNTQAPTLPTGVLFINTNGFSNTFGGIRIADTGAIAFSAVLTGTNVTGTNNRAFFTGLPGALHSIARTGDAAPGAPAGAVFTSFASIALSASGRVAFSAADSLSSGTLGIWAQDNSGTLRKIARVGDTITIGPTPHTISSIQTPATGTGSDGLPCSFSATGSLIVQAFFTDTTSAVLLARLGPRSDFNNDGSVTVADIFAFLTAWFAQTGQTGPGHSADFNGDNTVTVADIFAFLTAWFAGS